METLEQLFKETAEKTANEREEQRKHFLTQLKLADEWCDRAEEQLSFLRDNGFDVWTERRENDSDDSGVRITHCKTGRDVFIRPYVTCELKVMPHFQARSGSHPFCLSSDETMESLIVKLAEWA